MVKIMNSKRYGLSASISDDGKFSSKKWILANRFIKGPINLLIGDVFKALRSKTFSYSLVVCKVKQLKVNFNPLIILVRMFFTSLSILNKNV